MTKCNQSRLTAVVPEASLASGMHGSRKWSIMTAIRENLRHPQPHTTRKILATAGLSSNFQPHLRLAVVLHSPQKARQLNHPPLLFHFSRNGVLVSLPCCHTRRPPFRLHQSSSIPPVPRAGPGCSGPQPSQLQHHHQASVRCPRG